ncbi:hypothetical protein CVT26_015929 [Gymnopilus dilepis]|uniref:Acyl-protein thioesterase 1 n=1 Tax=Gymnopilus dilepis TaxID=231916 RepID=A0A409XYG1_9AGAR|nr:hypothetical protein CVT26_015929 [Gymnopilus dilepis]
MSVSWEESDGLPKCLVVPARKQHTATVFFLHGLGGSATGVKPFLQDLIEHPELQHVRFVLPTAPIMSITGMNGWTMYSWFDCYSFDHATRKEDEEGQHKAARWINDLIAREVQELGIPSNRIVIGGLSQGGAVSILAAITSERQLGGLYALSTYVPCRHKVPEIATLQSRTLPILWCHGTADKQVNYDTWKDLAKNLAEQLAIPFREVPDSPNRLSRDELVKAENGKIEMQWRTYEDLGHWFDEKELKDLAVWISVRLPEMNLTQE